jgi:hypothetical protein
VGSSDAAAKLEHARGLLRRAEDRAVRDRPAPEVGGGVDGGVDGGVGGRVLPVVAPLARLLPAGGLRRGTTVAVAAGPAATSLLWAVLVEASAGGAWVGVVGRPDLGLVAAAEAGMRLDRLALVPAPGPELMAVTSALLDGLDVVVTTVARPVPAGERQRLAARARQRGAVLCVLGSWPGADVQLCCPGAGWAGLGAGLHGGSGRLGQRQVEVRVLGRGMAPAGRVARLLMPAIPAAVPAAGAPAALAPAAVELASAGSTAADGSGPAALVAAAAPVRLAG